MNMSKPRHDFDINIDFNSLSKEYKKLVEDVTKDAQIIAKDARKMAAEARKIVKSRSVKSYAASGTYDPSITKEEIKSDIWDSGIWDDKNRRITIARNITNPAETELEKIRKFRRERELEKLRIKEKEYKTGGTLVGMAKKAGGGIGIGSIIFWGWIIWAFFLDNDKKEEVKDTATTKTKSVVEEMMPVVDKVKEKTKETVTAAKKEFEKVKKEKEKTDNNDPYASDDKYGDYEEKW